MTKIEPLGHKLLKIGDNWIKKGILASNHKEAYEKFIQEVGLYPKSVTVSSGSLGVWKEFDDHIEAAKQRIHEKEKAERDQLEFKKTKDYKGSIIKGEGDSFWITFNSITAAVKSAMEIQNELRESNISSLNSSRLAIRISITIGDILLQDDDIFGEAVNLCARSESITPHDEIYISNAAYLTLMKKNIKTDLVGKFSFKRFKDKELVYKFCKDRRYSRISRKY